MKLVFMILISFFLLEVRAETAKETTKDSTKKSAKAEGTEHSFEDLLVQGKYHFSDAAVTTVEEDKVLDSLLGVRSEFKDRIEQSSGRW